MVMSTPYDKGTVLMVANQAWHSCALSGRIIDFHIQLGDKQ
jgi:hypothetical protein